MNTGDLLARLRRHYITPGQPLPGGAFLSEVQTPRDVFPQRRVDALYIGFTQSRGNLLDGHELKVSRSDWLHELDQFNKADWWFSHTHRWWLVVPDLSVAKAEELPAGWGLMVVSPRTKTRLDVHVKAEVRSPEITMGLLLEITKKLDRMRSDAHQQELRDRGKLVSEMVAKQLDSTQVVDKRQAQRFQEAYKTLTRLQELTGLRFDGAPYENDLTWSSLEDSAEVLRSFCRDRVEANHALAATRRALEEVVRAASRALGEVEGARTGR
jgi:hypothetical protein